MAQAGAIRKVDELGRIVLPSELRKKLDWDTGDSVSVTEKDGLVILERVEKHPGPKCIFCKATESVMQLESHDICGGCLEKIKGFNASLQ